MPETILPHDVQVLEIPISEINREGRSRKEFGDVDSLAESIRTKGLLQPILITKNKKLVAGDRRIEAHLKLGHESILAVIREDLPDDIRIEYELEENLERLDMTWQEVVEARGKLYELRQERLGEPRGKGETRTGYGVKDLAEDLGLRSKGSLSADISLYYFIKENPEISRYQTKEAAIQQMRRLQENALLVELAGRYKGEGADEESGLEGEELYEDDGSPEYGTALRKTPIVPEWKLVQGDCIEDGIIKGISDRTIDLIITDPPWGLGSSDRRARDRSEFSDTAKEYVFFCQEVLPELWRILKDDAHLYIFLKSESFYSTREKLLNIGFDVINVPLIWKKPSGTGADLREPSFLVDYEHFLFAAKGGRALNKYRQTTFEFSPPGNEERLHSTQKPWQLLAELMSLSSVPNEIVFDPFVGSGSMIEAAIRTGRRSLGVELGASMYSKARMHLKEVEKELNGEEEDL